MINSIVLNGRLTKDPEMTYTNNGTSRTTFTLAVNRSFGDETDFINCQVWGKSAEALAKYAKKGHLIGVSGSLQINHYQDKDGNNRTYTVVNAQQFDFLTSKKDAEQGGNYQAPADNVTADDVPF